MSILSLENKDRLVWSSAFVPLGGCEGNGHQQVVGTASLSPQRVGVEILKIVEVTCLIRDKKMMAELSGGLHRQLVGKMSVCV